VNDNELAIQELDPDFTANSVLGVGASDTGVDRTFTVVAICMN